jgi:hypothetical protein
MRNECGIPVGMQTNDLGDRHKWESDVKMDVGGNRL